MTKQSVRFCWMLTFSVVFPLLANAQTFAVLDAFHESNNLFPSGLVPNAPLARDQAGNLYGTTYFGGTTCGSITDGCGVIYKLDSAGKQSVLYSFTGQSDGANPAAGFVPGSSGNGYGNAFAGGDLNCGQGAGCGTVFSVNALGKLTVTYTFTGAPDGQGPIGQLFRDQAGDLFGVTVLGGDSGCFLASDGCGVVFEVDSTGKESVLYTFLGPTASDGGYPSSGLVRDASGKFYGVTTFGGTINNGCPNPQNGCGTVYQLTHTSSGWTENVLYRFTGLADGGLPAGNLTIDSQGNLYGTTTGGGNGGTCPAGCGVIFKLTHGSGGWTESVLHQFTGGVDGAEPQGSLVRDRGGNFYGAAAAGGDTACGGCGTIFKFSRGGKLTAIHTFTGSDGIQPNGALFLDAAEPALYGTTGYGGDLSCNPQFGAGGCGVVFKMTP